MKNARIRIPTPPPITDPKIWHRAFSITSPLSGRICRKTADTSAQYGRSSSRYMDTSNASAMDITPFRANTTACLFGIRSCASSGWSVMKVAPLLFVQICFRVSFQINRNRHAGTDIHIVREWVERYINRNALSQTHPVKGLLHLRQHLVITAGIRIRYTTSDTDHLATELFTARKQSNPGLLPYPHQLQLGFFEIAGHVKRVAFNQ